MYAILKGTVSLRTYEKDNYAKLVTFKEFLADLGSYWGPWLDRWVMQDPKRRTGQDQSRGCDVCNFYEGWSPFNLESRQLSNIC